MSTVRPVLVLFGLTVGLSACLDFERAHQVCLAQNRCGGGDGGFGVPVIQQHPASVTVVAGREASFSSVATGADPLSWEWYADDVLLSDGPGTGRLAGGILTGSGTTTLRVWLVPLKADGVVIKARVRNPIGSQLSDPATLRLSTTGRVELVAGRPGGPGAADGVGAEARFQEPGGLAVDTNGDVFVADTANHTIRKVTAEGVVTTVAGRAGYSGYENKLNREARFFEPSAVTRDNGGTLYVADTANNCIRAISPAGVVTTVAGNPTPGAIDGTGGTARFNAPVAVAWAPPDRLYVADAENHTIRVIVVGGGVVGTRAGQAGSVGSTDGLTTAARFSRPTGVAADAFGNVWVADSGNFTIRKISDLGVVTTVAGLAGVSGSSNGTGNGARFADLRGLAYDNDTRNLYVLDHGAIRQVTAAGVVSTLAGAADQAGSADGTGASARFGEPTGIAMGPGGVLVVADTGNGTLRRVTRTGVVTTLAGAPPTTGNADGSGAEARFTRPAGVAIDPNGGAWVTDAVACTIRLISPLGDVTTVAGAENDCVFANGPAQTARFNQPVGIAISALGVVYVADTGNGVIRRIDPSTRVVSTFAGVPSGFGNTDGPRLTARFFAPVGLALRGETELFVSDPAANTIRHITTTGDVTTLAGSPMMSGSDDGIGAAARFSTPLALTYAKTGPLAGILFVADTDNNLVRAITISARAVSTFAGTGEQGAFDGPNGAATFAGPNGLEVSDDALFVTEQWNHTVRRIRNGTVSTALGTAGVGRVMLGPAPGGLNAPFGIAARQGVLLLTSPFEPAVLRAVP
ncbi:MAG: hypothetical protein JNJ54_23880 [Myxococcaceae bacterium]|nr:hypothetical protein [Myxococcaceae bacterium]